MAISLICPHCNSNLNIKDDYAGKTIRCPRCKQPFAVPDADELAAASGPSSPSVTSVPNVTSSPGASSNPFSPPGGGGVPKIDTGDDSGASGLYTRKRTYPALVTASKIYAILAIVVVVLGGIAAVITVLGLGLAASQGVMNLAFLGLTLAYLVGIGLGTFIYWITLKAASEFIQLAMHVEHDTHVTSDATRKLVEVMQNRST